MGENSDANTESKAIYLAELLSDKEKLKACSSIFIHVNSLLDREIALVRKGLFTLDRVFEVEPKEQLPKAEGPVEIMSEKVFVPVSQYPGFNFVGRILGPRGLTVKQLEDDTGCKMAIRGKGSMRDQQREERFRGNPSWSHLLEDLHVLVTAEDTKKRAEIKLKRAVKELKKLLVPTDSDELKRRQMVELAILNGTFHRRRKGMKTVETTDNGTYPPVQFLNDLSFLSAFTPKFPPFSTPPPLLPPTPPVTYLDRPFAPEFDYATYIGLLTQYKPPLVKANTHFSSTH